MPCRKNEKLVDARTYYNGRERDYSLQVAQERAEMDRRNREGRETSRAWYPTSTRSAPTERDLRKERCAEARQNASNARGKGYNNSTLVWLDKQAVDACAGL